MLEVLLWLGRFDLDGKQITNRRLCSLFENKRMPLRNVDRVVYEGDPRGYPNPTNKTHRLSIILAAGERDGADEVELQIETDADVQKAASYLSSCFVSDFSVYGHLRAPPKNAIISAPALIDEIGFRNCSFANGDEDSLGETLGGSTFRCLVLVDSSIPVWQIDDNRLDMLRTCGCNELHVCPSDTEPYDDDEKLKVTEEGIVSYCFALDGGLAMPEKRYLKITWVNITPAFFKKVVEASKSSQLTCDVELRLDHLPFDVSNLDVGVQPSRYQEYDRYAWMEYMHHVRYNIADHGNGIRLLVHFKSEDGRLWNAIVRHGKKDHEEFFEPKPDVEEPHEDYCLEAHDFFDEVWN
ncbi:hypothetical protein AAVH_22021 [Aphelenchoides avenae]|nr:hypothetical protein AAVH_22021 [Aphelenchus avenae]